QRRRVGMRRAGINSVVASDNGGRRVGENDRCGAAVLFYSQDRIRIDLHSDLEFSGAQQLRLPGMPAANGCAIRQKSLNKLSRLWLPPSEKPCGERALRFQINR